MEKFLLSLRRWSRGCHRLLLLVDCSFPFFCCCCLFVTPPHHDLFILIGFPNHLLLIVFLGNFYFILCGFLFLCFCWFYVTFLNVVTILSTWLDFVKTVLSLVNAYIFSFVNIVISYHRVRYTVCTVHSQKKGVPPKNRSLLVWQYAVGKKIDNRCWICYS